VGKIFVLAGVPMDLLLSERGVVFPLLSFARVKKSPSGCIIGGSKGAWWLLL